MADFTVDPSKLKSCMNEMDAIADKLKQYRTETERVMNALTKGDSSIQTVKTSLKHISDDLKNNKEHVSTLKASLKDISSLYTKTEESITSKKIENGVTSEGVAFGAPNGMYQTGDNSYALKYKKGTKSGKVLGIASSGTLAGEFFGFSTKNKFSSGISYKDNEDGSRTIKDVNILTAEKSIDAYVFKGSGKGNIGLLSGNTEVKALEGTATGSITASLIKNGRLDPQLEAKLEGKAVALAGSADASLGSKNNNIHGKATGELLEAKADATAGVGKITYKDKATGEEKTGYGAKLEGGAEAYLASGKVSGGVNILGIKIDVGAKGHAGGASAKGGGYATTDGLGLSADLGLGLGLGLDLSVDWSGFKIGW